VRVEKGKGKDYPRYFKRDRKELYPQMKQAPTNARLKRVFSKDLYSEWCDMERSMLPSFRQTFTRLERIIIFSKMIVGWGLEKMEKKLNISGRQVRRTYKRLGECGYQAIDLTKTRKRGNNDQCEKTEE
jgi:hypothetical protein